jgi:hypothetical protein
LRLLLHRPRIRARRRGVQVPEQILELIPELGDSQRMGGLSQALELVTRRAQLVEGSLELVGKPAAVGSPGRG